MVHNKLNRKLSINLWEVLAMHRCGIHLIFPDIDFIQRKMEAELLRKYNGKNIDN